MVLESSIPDPPVELRNGNNCFRLIKKIGEGGFARCYEIIEIASNRKFALKATFLEAICKLKPKQRDRLFYQLTNEIELHRKLDHRHIVKLYKTFHDANFIYMVMELCEKKTLVELLKEHRKVAESQVKYYIWQLITAVSYLHGKNIVHRDLKLGNIFLNLEDEVKIGDFGLATTIDNLFDRKRTICGTPNYIAPEVLFDKERGHSYEVDIWSLGVIMYSLLFGKQPFQSNDVKNIYRNIKENIYEFPVGIQVSDVAKSLISQLLISDPDKRPKLEQILTHPFFSDVIAKEISNEDFAFVRSFCNSTKLSSVQLGSSDNYDKENMNLTGHRRSKTSSSRKSGLVETVYRVISSILMNHNEFMTYDEKLDLYDGDVPVHIERWIDFTNKYGIGYICSNGIVGAFFNDSTIMTLDATIGSLQYLDQNVEDSLHQEKSSFTMENYPATLKKKVTIIKYFHSYLTKEKISLTTKASSQSSVDYVLKMAKFSQAFIYRLSNRVIQVCFFDNYKIALYNDGRHCIVNFSNAAEPTHHSSTYTALQKNVPEFQQHLTYFKNMLELLSTNNDKKK